MKGTSIYIDDKKFVSTDEAFSTDVSRDELISLCDSGKIECRNIGGSWYANEESLRAFYVGLENQNVNTVHDDVKIGKETTQQDVQDYIGNTESNSVGYVDSVDNSVSVPSVITSKSARKTSGDVARRGRATITSAPRTTVKMLPSPHALLGTALTILLFLFAYNIIGMEFSGTKYARFDAVQEEQNVVKRIASASGSTARDSVAAAGDAYNSAARYIKSIFGLLNVGDENYNIGENIKVNSFDGIEQFVFENEPDDLVTTEISGVTSADFSQGSATTDVAHRVQQVQPIQQTIVQQPVIERIIETQRIVTQGGISREELNTRLQEVQNYLLSQITSQSSANSASIVNNYSTIAQTNKIDQLTNTTINTPTITGGSISGVTISGGSVAATSLSGTLGISSGGTGTSTAPTYGQVLLGDASGNYSLTATSSLGISTGADFAWTTTGYGVSTSTIVGFTNGFLSSASSTISELSVINSTTTNATTTNFAISSLTSGSIPFIGTNGILTQDNTNFFIEDLTSRVGIGTSTVGAMLNIYDTTYGQLQLGYDQDNYYDFNVSSDGGIVLTSYGTDPDINFDLTRSSDADFSVNTNDLFVDTSSGNIGIGTTTPYSKLSVWGESTGNIFEAVTNASSSALTITSAGNVTFQNETDSTTGFQVLDADGGTAVFNIDTTNERVGIGTAAPETTLHISGGNLLFDNNIGIQSKDSGGTIRSVLSWDSSDNLQVGSVSALANIIFSTATVNEAMRIDTNGNVGIGATAPTSDLTIQASGATLTGNRELGVHNDSLTGGTISVVFSTDDAGASNEYFLAMRSEEDSTPDNEFLFRTDGTALADGAFTGGGADVAEWTPTSDTSLEPGDVLVIDGTSDSALVKKSSTDASETIVGIVSTNPGLVAGGGGAGSLEDPNNHDNDVLVTLSGRVPVKFSDENGIVSPGDSLTSSVTKPGYAMKMMAGGQSIGIVMRPPDAEGKVLTFVRLAYRDLFIDSSGNIGIGTTSPQYKLHVAGDVAATGFVNTSSREEKKNIRRLSDEDNVSALEKLSSVFVSTYYYKRDGGENKRLGLIAEEAPEEILSSDGRGVDLYKFVSFLTSAFKALVLKVDTLFGVVESFDRKVSTSELCIGETCITESELVRLLESNSAGQSASVAAPVSKGVGKNNKEKPTITINGNNPAEISIGAEYADLGANVTDNKDENLGVHTYLNGKEVSEIKIDTSTSSTYTIDYIAIDNDGNTSTNTRLVIVGEGGSAEVIKEELETNLPESETSINEDESEILLETSTSTSTSTESVADNNIANPPTSVLDAEDFDEDIIENELHEEPKEKLES